MRTVFPAIACSTLALLGACATATPSSGTTTPQQVTVVESSEGRLQHFADPAVPVAIAAPPARVFAALRAAYDSVTIPVTASDPAALTLGNRGYAVRRMLAGMPLTDLVDCGAGLIGPRAASYRVYLNVTSTVAPAAGGSTIRTNLQAVAINPESSGEQVRCTSRGRLEEVLSDLVKLGVGAP